MKTSDSEWLRRESKSCVADKIATAKNESYHVALVKTKCCIDTFCCCGVCIILWSAPRQLTLCDCWYNLIQRTLCNQEWYRVDVLVLVCVESNHGCIILCLCLECVQVHTHKLAHTGATNTDALERVITNLFKVRVSSAYSCHYHALSHLL